MVGITKHFKLSYKLIFNLYKCYIRTITSTYIYTLMKFTDASFDDDTVH